MVITKDLLVHWWHYYGKMMYTLAELETFTKIIDEQTAERVFDIVIASHIEGDGSPTVILLSIRKNLVDKLFDSLPNVENMNQKNKTIYESVKDEVFQMISSTAN